jgi:hypothetical protein
MDLAVGDRLCRIDFTACPVLVVLPCPDVPDDDVAPAILPCRDHTFEVEVVQLVVLDMEGRTAYAGVERRTLRHRPADEHIADLQAEVVVEVSRPVPLHHEPAPANLRRWHALRLPNANSAFSCQMTLRRSVAVDSAGTFDSVDTIRPTTR